MDSHIKLKVLIVSTIVLPISSNLKYAGTERVVYDLNKELALRRDVQTIVASTGDARIDYGKLIFYYKKSLWNLENHERNIVFDLKNYYEKHMNYCLDYALKNKIDVIHDHAGLVHSDAYQSRKNSIPIPILSTIHGIMYLKLVPQYALWRQAQIEKRPVFFITVSKFHRRNFQQQSGVKIFDYVYNGIDVDQFPYVPLKNKSNYLLWIGRINRDKGTDLAIKVAQHLRIPLILAGEVHTQNKEFYEQMIRPHITNFIGGKNFDEQEKQRNAIIKKIKEGKKILADTDILYIGPVDDVQKGVLYSKARALLMLNRWEEPFGLVMPEAMATGTPVIGTKLGAIPEVVEDKKTGFVIPVQWINKENSELDEDLLILRVARAVSRISYLSSLDCRKHVEKNFTSEIMADKYLDIYNRLSKMTTNI